jgi:type IV pilus assembly protein PilM
MALLAFAISYASFARGLSTVDAKQFDTAERKAGSVAQTSTDIKSKVDAEKTRFTETLRRGQALVGNIEGRYLWLEMLKVVNACLPVDKPPAANPTASGEPVYRLIEDRDELHIASLECVWVENVRNWYNKVYKPASAGRSVDLKGGSARADEYGGTAGGAEGGSQEQPAGGGEEQADAKDAPDGPGFIITVKGRHYHNYTEAGKLQLAQYVKDKFIRGLQDPKVKIELPVREGNPTKFTPKELGLRFPVLVNPGQVRVETVENPNVEGAGARPGVPAKPVVESAAGRAPKTVEVRVFDFMVQMIWQPTPVTKRLENRQKAEQASSEAAPPAAQP